MENVSEREFMEKFGQLTPQNQRYLVSIQEALSFAQQTGTQLNSDELKKDLLDGEKRAENTR